MELVPSTGHFSFADYWCIVAIRVCSKLGGTMSGNVESTVSSATLQHAREGVESAWNSIVLQYTPRVYRWCRQASVPQQDAVDLAQDVLTKVFVSLNTISRDRDNGESLGAWLFTVTRNRIRDYYRSRPRHPIAQGRSEDFLIQRQAAADVSSSLGNRSRIERLHEILDAVRSDVDDSTWQAFWRLAIDGDPASEIASDLNMTEGAVRQAKYRVMQKLRQEGA